MKSFLAILAGILVICAPVTSHAFMATNVDMSMSGGAVVVGHGSSFTMGSAGIYSGAGNYFHSAESGASGGVFQESHVCCGMAATSGGVEASASALHGHHVSAAQSSVSSSSSSMTVGWANASSSSGGNAWGAAH